MKKRYILPLPFIVLFMAISCDPVYDYTYQITNNAGSDVVIKLKRTYRIDSTYFIPANETTILFVTSHGVESPGGPHFSDVYLTLDEFFVIKDDTLVSTKDYLDNFSWKYDNGLYSAEISKDEFE